MGCNCGKKKRMAQYSSKQLQQQASGQAVDGAVVASATGESTKTGQTGQQPGTAAR